MFGQWELEDNINNLGKNSNQSIVPRNEEGENDNFKSAVDSLVQKKKSEKNKSVLIFEISTANNGVGVYKEMTFRELLAEILLEIENYTPKSLLVFDHYSLYIIFLTIFKIHRQDEDTFTYAVLPLRMRDLRRLDFATNPNEELAVLVRRHVVIFTVDPLRAVITSQKLRLIVPPGGDTELTIFEQYMRDWILCKKNIESMDNYEANKHSIHDEHGIMAESNNISNDSNTQLQANQVSSNLIDTKTIIPKQFERLSTQDIMEESKQLDPDINTINAFMHQTFEMHAFESILLTVRELLSAHFSSIQAKAIKVIKYVSTGSIVTPPIQQRLNFLKDETTKMESRLHIYRENLDSLIEDDETMAFMNITSLKNNPTLYSYPLSSVIMKQHELVEELLEVYLADLCSSERKLKLLLGKLCRAESQASLRLDITRNKTLSVNIMIMLFTVNASFAGYLAGIFAMNLDNAMTIHPVSGTFAILFSGITAVFIILLISGYYLIKRWNIIQSNDDKNENMY